VFGDTGKSERWAIEGREPAAEYCAIDCVVYVSTSSREH
jgi:hypothetical protein